MKKRRDLIWVLLARLSELWCAWTPDLSLRRAKFLHQIRLWKGRSR